ncbi:MAG: hypothetical protein AAF236_11940 [Verrucomicrobiota bacterium]
MVRHSRYWWGKLSFAASTLTSYRGKEAGMTVVPLVTLKIDEMEALP